MYITYPKSINVNEYCFKLNTDDYPSSKTINKYLRDKGIDFKYSKSNSSTKLIGWHVYKIKADKPIKNFRENIEFAENLFKDFN